MALGNGVLVHSPRYWACAVRGSDDRLQLASGEKTIRSIDVRSPALRGPARVAEVFALFPSVRRALPEARLPFLERRTIGVMSGAALLLRAVRRSRLRPVAQETVGALLALVPAALAVRGTDVAAYHGAEHISIGSYEHGEQRPREHERCGSHMLGPLLAASAAGNVLAARVGSTPRGRAAGRTVAGLGALALATELFSWMLRNPQHPVSRVLAWPGMELQSRVLTAEPTSAQLEVAQAALAECLRLETGDVAELGA
jgi:hypothetical protein